MEIPQVEETFAVLLSRPFWMWGAEMGANEHGLAIGNTAVFTREPYARTGLTGMDLLRLALERADGAERAVEVILALLGEYGQGGGCGHEHPGFTYHNSFMIADPAGAFLLETAGRRHALEKIAGPRTISNGLTISGFAEEHSDVIKTYGSACRSRRARTRALSAEVSGVGDMMAALRDHGENRSYPAYSWLNGGLGVPCVHAGGLLAASQTVASWVSELGAGTARHWVTATAAPCTGLFKPVRVEESLELGPAPTDRADDRSLFWRHERLHRAVMRNPQAFLPLFIPERDKLQARWIDDPPEPPDAFSEADSLLQKWTERVHSEHAGAERAPDLRPWWVRRYWARRNRWADLDTGSLSGGQKT
jgi:dipeptidase